jgi:hypothetical protein
MVPLTGFAIYFITYETKQLIKSGISYFTSGWNYLDILPPIILLVFIPLAIAGYFDKREYPDNPGVLVKNKETMPLEASLQATMSLMLWLKFLYFLRIFDSTGYLIRIITEVVVDMRHFLLIMLLTIIAFGDAMRSISTSELEEN